MKRQGRDVTRSPFEELHNYFEYEVLTALKARNLGLDADTFVDVLALALNELPPRYIRHKVDMVYFTEREDLTVIKQQIELAIDHALAYLREQGDSGARGETE